MRDKDEFGDFTAFENAVESQALQAVRADRHKRRVEDKASFVKRGGTDGVSAHIIIK